MTERSEPAAGGDPVRLPRSADWDAAGHDGYRYRVSAAWPAEPAPPGGFPAIYVLDANAVFATVVEAVRMRARRPDVTGVTPTVVVGVGHAIEGPYHRERRRYDYTSGPAAGTAEEAGTGGAARFLDFLETVVRPEVERRLPLDGGRRTLFGHSLAGFLALHAIAAAPGAFRAYVAASPSVWWDRPLLGRVADAVRARPTGAEAPRVLIGVGGYEERLAPWEVGGAEAATIAERRAARRMVSGAREVAGELAAAGARVHFEEFAGEDHASAVLLTVNRFLRFALAP